MTKPLTSKGLTSKYAEVVTYERTREQPKALYDYDLNVLQFQKRER